MRQRKELRWTNGDAYGGKTYNKQKHVWYDRDLQIGGSTLDLVAHHKGEQIQETRSAARNSSRYGEKRISSVMFRNCLPDIEKPPPVNQADLSISR